MHLLFFYLVLYHIRRHRIINIKELPLPWIHMLVFFFNVCFESCFSEKNVGPRQCLVSSSIIEYHPVSSSIIRYHPVSSGIIRYHQVSCMIKNDQKWSSVYQKCYNLYQKWYKFLSLSTEICDRVLLSVLRREYKHMCPYRQSHYWQYVLAVFKFQTCQSSIIGIKVIIILSPCYSS